MNIKLFAAFMVLAAASTAAASSPDVALDARIKRSAGTGLHKLEGHFGVPSLDVDAPAR